jgi:hypothetical protein
MPGVVTVGGNVRMLGGLTERLLTLRLFVNDRVPEKGDTLSEYTEASGGGYAALDLPPGPWTVMPTVPALASYPEQTLGFTGLVGDVYGYLLTDGEDLVVAERFGNGPYDVRRNGDQIKITPRIEQA